MRRFMLLVAGLALLAGVATAVSGGATQAKTHWVITDLGTLGGSESYAAAINAKGQVVGWANTKAKGPYGEIEHAFLWENGRMRDLGTLGGRNSNALAINERGQIVGWAYTKLKDKDGEQIVHAFLWESGRMYGLGTLGGPRSSASDINNRAQIVGWADTRAKDKYDVPGAHAGHAFLVGEKGKMLDLGTFGGSNSMASAISERGQIVGSADTKAKDADGEIEHAFSWQGGHMRDLGGIHGRRSAASDVNERGQIVGDLETGRKDTGGFKGGSVPVWHAFLWENGKMRDLTAHGPNSTASAVNGSGQIVGAWWKLGNTLSDPWDQAALWQGGRMVLLGSPVASHAYGVNSRGEIVGWSWIRAADWEQHAVLWTLRRG